MRTMTRRAAVLVAAGALGLGGLAVAIPAVAGVNPFAQQVTAAWGPGPGPGGDGGMGPGSGMGPGGGMGPGAGMGAGPRSGAGMGTMTRDGGCLGTGVTAAKGTLTPQQQATLATMAQEEKLAHDLYAAFAEAYPVRIFDRIAASETQHLTAVRTLLDRYGLADPTAGQAAGKFTDPAVRANYDRLLAKGRTGQAVALQVGVEVEKADIAALTAARAGLTAPDVKQLYTHLLAASQHHLAAFTSWSTS